TLDLILLSFACPHLCIFIPIFDKWDHRLSTAVCVPSSILCVVASGFAFEHHWTTVVPVITVLFMLVATLYTSIAALQVSLKMHILVVVRRTTISQNIDKKHYISFFEIRILQRVFHLLIKLYATIILLFAGLSGWLLSWSQLSWWLAATAAPI
ncbi:hypothetical protein PFISCL1PPCAC_8473, partial [Pristionchus fissidentatus]